jgi:hypothetical protein
VELAKALIDRVKRSSRGIAAGAVPDNENPPDGFRVSGNPETRQTPALTMSKGLRDRIDRIGNRDQHEHDCDASRAKDVHL